MDTYIIIDLISFLFNSAFTSPTLKYEDKGDAYLVLHFLHLSMQNRHSNSVYQMTILVWSSDTSAKQACSYYSHSLDKAIRLQRG